MIATQNPSVFVLVIEPDETLANQLSPMMQFMDYNIVAPVNPL
jgi:hypothetical protein